MGVELVEKTDKKVVLDSRIVRAAERLFDNLGIPFDEAINVYLYQAVYTQSIPFPIQLPNDFDGKTVEEYIQKKYGKKFNEESRTNE